MFRTLLLLILPAALLSAQGRLRPERPRPNPRAEARRELRRDRVMAVVHQLRMRRIQQSLGVPEDRARAIADRWARFDEDSHDRRQGMKQLREQVNGILVGPGSENEKNAKLKPMVEQMAVLQKQQQETKQAFEDDIRSSLSPAEQGRFILLMEEFNRALLEAMAKEKQP
jgi:hypothetical protein